MTKRIITLGIILFILAILGIFIYERAHVSFYDDGARSVSIIGGADGPTSVFIAGKLGGEEQESEEGEEKYMRISMAKAKAIFEEPGDYIILDVRTEDEYNEGHIPGAINVANEFIDDFELEELPDLDQTIYVYCRSGRRSMQAAAKLEEIGYTNIIEIGGILDWTGEIEK